MSQNTYFLVILLPFISRIGSGLYIKDANYNLEEPRSDDFFPGLLFKDIVFAPIYSEYEKCKQSIDVGFILDASGSLYDEYIKMKHFIQGLAKTFEVSEHGTHAAVVQFSRNAEHVIKLNDYTDSDGFNFAVSKLIPYLLTTRIDRGLEIARDELFAVKNGGRPNKKKLVILITDGKQTRDVDYVKPEDIAAEIRNKGIAILVIGVGDQVDDNELQSIAGPSDNWRKARDFDELRSKEFVEKMTRKACDIPYTERTCASVVDIAFLIDASGSIDKYTDFKRMKEFVTRIANTFQLSEDGAHAGIVVFSDYINESRNRHFTKISAYLRDGKSPPQFRKAVENSKHIGYRTRIDLAFKLVSSKIFNVKYGSRPNVKKIIILLTDGKQTPDIPRYDPILASKTLYDKGVKIYAIGIGHRINHDELKAITRTKSRVFYAETFKSLESQEFVKNVSTQACSAARIYPSFKFTRDYEP